MYRRARAALRGTSTRSGQVANGTPKPVCPVVKDLLLKSLSDAMCRPVRSTETATTWVWSQPTLRRPRAVPVRLPPPACVTATTSGWRP